MFKEKKMITIIVTVLLIAIISIRMYQYELVNPKNDFGKRCKTPYNQNKYKLKLSEDEIDIPENSCYVMECCMHVAEFRSKKEYRVCAKIK